MTDRLAGKTAFITAAGQGIGRATAEAFVREGARVVATDIDEALLAELKQATGCAVRRLDVTDAGAVAAAAKEALGSGRVDVLFNGAGYVHAGTILECDELAFDFSFDLNVRAMYRVTRAFLPPMLKLGGGSIVNVASAALSIKGVPNRFVYAATKAASTCCSVWPLASAWALMRWRSDGDSTVPGQIALQRIPWVMKSAAIDLVMPMTAALVVA